MNFWREWLQNLATFFSPKWLWLHFLQLALVTFVSSSLFTWLKLAELPAIMVSAVQVCYYLVVMRYVFGPTARWILQRSTRPTRVIVGPPGCMLKAIVEFVYHPQTVELIFCTALADLHNEHCEALAKGRFWKARWVRVRGYWSFWKAVLGHSLFSVLDNFVRIWKLIP